MLADRALSCIMIETDGDCRRAISWMIEAGATGIWPLECTNGQNVIDVRNAYPNLQIFRGIDHAVPHDVSFDAYRYYRDRLRNSIEKYG